MHGGFAKNEVKVKINYALFQSESRRFRMKFSPTTELSGDVQCRSCVDELTKYFPIKMTTAGVESQQVEFYVNSYNTYILYTYTLYTLLKIFKGTLRVLPLITIQMHP